MRLTVYGLERVITGTAREEFVAFAVPVSNPRLRLTIVLSDPEVARIRDGLLEGGPVQLDDFEGHPVGVKFVDEAVSTHAGY